MAKVQFRGTGRRKSSVARVRLVPGTGNITVNKKPLDDYIALEIVKREVKRPFEIAGSRVVAFKDYKRLIQIDGNGKESIIDMPETSDVLQWFCEDGTKVSVRPSGTEPKIKFYIEVKGEMKCAGCYERCMREADEKIEAIKQSFGL